MKYLFLFIFIVLINQNAKAQAFTLDTTFYVNFNFYYPSSGAWVGDILFEADNKLMIYGGFNNGAGSLDVIRTYSNGDVDNTWHYYYDDGVSLIKHIDNYYYIFTSLLENKFDYHGYETDTLWEHNINEDDVCHQFNMPYVYPDGTILVGTEGACLNPDSKTRYFKKFLPDGHMDTNFRHNTNGYVNGVVPYSSDKFLLYGTSWSAFTEYDSIPYYKLCRIDSSGTLDTTFKNIFTPSSVTGDIYPRAITPIYVQDDGKILICGVFTIQGCLDTLHFIRLNADGSLDSTFNNFHNVLHTIWGTWGISCVCPSSDGGYLIGGGFRQYQDSLRNNIVKTDKNGYVDNSYFNGLGVDSAFHSGDKVAVSKIIKGDNDTYYVMGYFTYYNGQHVNPIIRIKGLSAGIEENKEKNEMQLYPNPVKDEVNLSFLKAIANGVAEIYDVSGIKVKEILLKGRQSQYVISTESLAAGFYIVSVRNEKGVVRVTKMMKCN